MPFLKWEKAQVLGLRLFSLELFVMASVYSIESDSLLLCSVEPVLFKGRLFSLSFGFSVKIEKPRVLTLTAFLFVIILTNSLL